MWDVTPVFLCPSRNNALDFREHRDLHRPCAIYRSIFLIVRHLPQNLQRLGGSLVQISPIFGWPRDLLVVLSAPLRILERERGMSFAVVL